MQVIIRANKPQTMRSDIGQYNVITKKLTVWVNSSRLMNGETILRVPDFELPDDVKKIVLEDAGTDASFPVPLDVFKEVKNEISEHYEIPWNEWYKKYRVPF